jgi:hypothetical protein
MLRGRRQSYPESKISIFKLNEPYVIDTYNGFYYFIGVKSHGLQHGPAFQFEKLKGGYEIEIGQALIEQLLDDNKIRKLEETEFAKALLLLNG